MMKRFEPNSGREKSASPLRLAQFEHFGVVLAMADWQLGQKDAARVMLFKGNSLTPKISPTDKAVDLGDSWVAWLEARISLDEAEGLMKSDAGGDADANHPAPMAGESAPIR